MERNLDKMNEETLPKRAVVDEARGLQVKSAFQIRGTYRYQNINQITWMEPVTENNSSRA